MHFGEESMMSPYMERKKMSALRYDTRRKRLIIDGVEGYSVLCSELQGYMAD